MGTLPVAIHVYDTAVPPLAICLNLEITEHPPAGKITFDPDQIHYWFTDIVYFRNTTVENIIPDGFFDNPNTYMVIQIDHEGVTLDNIGPIKKSFDIITSTIPNERIILVVGSHPQLDYITKFYPALRENAFMFNFWEIWSRHAMVNSKRISCNERNHRRFLYLNRRNYAERMYAFSILWKSQEFRNNSYTSFNPGNYWNQDPVHLAQQDQLLQDSLNACKQVDPDIETWYAQQFLPQLPTRYSSNDPFTYEMRGDNLLQAYADTDINIVVESNAYWIPQRFFPTEKLFRSIGMRRPFIVYGQPGYYESLKTLGYMTYENVFGEIHDKLTDNWQRGNSFADTVIALANLTNTEFNKVIDSTKRIRKYNYWNFIKRTNLDTLAALLPESAKPLAGFLRYPPW